MSRLVRFDPSLLPIALLLAAGCGGDRANAPPTEGVTLVEIRPGAATLVYLEEQYQLSATAWGTDGKVVPDQPTTWTSSDSAVVGVSPTGLVMARREGEARVTATIAGVNGRVTIRVDFGQAASRCTDCHGPTAGHRLFPGTTCPDCHLPAFGGYLNPSHEFPLPGHRTLARGFGLIGAHSALACGACHLEPAGPPRFQPADTSDCIACHEADYQRRHAGSNFPRTCLVCHSTLSFRGATFDHSSGSARFRLIGVHTSLACGSCHGPNGAPLFSPRDQNDCVACHQADYLRKHAGSGYPTSCTSCHTPTRWLDASFDHATASGGRFTLVGAHLTRPCTVCHDATTGAPLFTPLSQNDCITCHRADYQRQHDGSGFPTTCPTCHTTSTFVGAVFDHDGDFFPISSGTHQNRWSGCTVCHVVPADYTQFSCFGCHYHNQESMDAEHRGRTGYRYASDACLSCHPRP